NTCGILDGLSLEDIPGWHCGAPVHSDGVFGGNPGLSLWAGVVLRGAGVRRRAGSHVAGLASELLPGCVLDWIGRVSAADWAAAVSERGVAVVAYFAARCVQQLGTSFDALVPAAGVIGGAVYH